MLYQMFRLSYVPSVVTCIRVLGKHKEASRPNLKSNLGFTNLFWSEHRRRRHVTRKSWMRQQFSKGISGTKFDQFCRTTWQQTKEKEGGFSKSFCWARITKSKKFGWDTDKVPSLDVISFVPGICSTGFPIWLSRLLYHTNEQPKNRKS